MAYPTATIYDYRVREVEVTRTPSEGYFVAEYSTNGGTTWLPLFPFTFGDETSAMNEIGNVVSEEAQFRTKVQTGEVPVVSVTAYPGNT